ncbi:hypothetical protein [Streptomyces sp. I05A-00742]|uniref:hypothetical protein n=1 Tax=Streptomyces sp. I05A-00742 TaxID=2732853 RepID=UPI0014877C79|nr:hypothetical protein [Streptomyces sp. I05A-00742]
MIEIRFTVRPGQGDPHGFDLGDILCEGPLGRVSSAGHTPDQGMMIYPSVVLLLDSLREFFNGGRKVARFIGVDSSFELVVRRRGKGCVVAAGSKPIAEVERDELAESVLSAAEELARTQLARVAPHDAAKEDYLAALTAFRSATGEWRAAR